MVRPEKGSLADRSDIKNRVRSLRKRRSHPNNGNGSPAATDQASPFDVSFGSSVATSGTTDAAKGATPKLSSSPPSTPTQPKPSQHFLGRQWSPIAESARKVESSANGTSSILFEFKSSDEASSPLMTSQSANQVMTKFHQTFDTLKTQLSNGFIQLKSLLRSSNPRLNSCSCTAKPKSPSLLAVSKSLTLLKPNFNNFIH